MGLRMALRLGLIFQISMGLRLKFFQILITNLKEINRIGNFTEFHQLFGITVNLSSILVCSLNSIDGNEIISHVKCEDVGEPVEFLSKDKRFEKCLTFSTSIKNRYFENLKMHKSSHIELRLILDELEDFHKPRKNNFSDLLYLSIHSSQSILKTNFFFELNLIPYSGENIVQRFSFSKSIVHNLQ
jgi:hypothetical protein